MKKFNLTLKENYTSENLFNKISILEYSTIDNFSDGMSWVENNEIQGVLIGGTAVVNYLKSGRDLTPDIDYLVSNLNDVKTKLEKDNIDFKPIKDSKLGNIGITVPKFNIDFLDSKIGNKAINELILKTFTRTKIGGEDINIINPELLIIMKLNLGRTKDINDGFELLKSNKIDKKTYIKYVDLLKNHLDDYESLKSYAELI